MDVTDDLEHIEQGVLEVLVGTPLDAAAARTSMSPAELSDAVEVYRVAGLAALRRLFDQSGWCQVELQLPDPSIAEQTVVTQLWPLFRKAEAIGLISAWWFIRKSRWRFRFLTGDGVPLEVVKAHVGQVLEGVCDGIHPANWCVTHYEPETHAFGGTEAMVVAHRLFHHDSRCFMEYLTDNAAAGRRELSMLLCSVLSRAAGQDWYEQGDIWARVTNMRTDASLPTSKTMDRIKPKVQRLLSVDAGPDSTLVHQGSLQFAAEWISTFHEAGKAIGDLAKQGKLGRGVRDVLAHHVIFHWNRIALPASDQAVLARTARDVVLGPDQR